MSLPTHLTGTDVENCPGLTNLLKNVSKFLDKDGLLKSSKEDVQQAMDNLEKEKFNYYQEHILYHELHELMIDREILKSEIQDDSQSEQYIAALSECVGTAEVCNYLKPRTDTTAEVASTLLGLTPSDLEKFNPNMKKLAVLQQQFIPDLESRLKLKCEEVASCHFSPSYPGKEQVSFARAARLPDILKEECMKLEEELLKSQLDKAQINVQFWQLCYALTEALTILEALISKHRLELQAEVNSITVDWLSARCHAMHLKIRVFRSRLMCEMYKPEVVTALDQIREHLKLSIKERESEEIQLDQALRSYRTIGMGFEELVQEYEQLQNAVASKKWALTELKQSLTEY